MAAGLTGEQNVTSAPNDTPVTRGGLLTDRGRLLTGISFLLGLATILGAWGSQILGGLVPCDLCLEQRLAYYWGLPLLALILLLWDRLPGKLLALGLLLGAATFVWSTWMAVYHAGVEMKLWAGPSACTGVGGEISFSDLTNINATRVVPCDAIQFEFLGITLAGYNALISVAIVVMLLVAAATVWRRSASSR
jgi:disulfide bond formation protein DsbB